MSAADRKIRESIARQLAEAEDMMRRQVGHARYWAKEARRLKGKGIEPSGELALLKTDRKIASDWRAEVHRLRELAKKYEPRKNGR